MGLFYIEDMDNCRLKNSRQIYRQIDTHAHMHTSTITPVGAP